MSKSVFLYLWATMAIFLLLVLCIYINNEKGIWLSASILCIALVFSPIQSRVYWIVRIGAAATFAQIVNMI